MATTDKYKLDYAREIIRRCEQDLNRKLSKEECRDLLADNTDWSLEFIKRCVEYLF